MVLVRLQAPIKTNLNRFRQLFRCEVLNLFIVDKPKIEQVVQAL